MRTYGIFGGHTTEGCPLFNRENRQLLLFMVENFENKAHRYNVKIKEQYHSGLEHTFVWNSRGGQCSLNRRSYDWNRSCKVQYIENSTTENSSTCSWIMQKIRVTDSLTESKLLTWMKQKFSPSQVERSKKLVNLFKAKFRKQC